jgi:hypothetical protein
MSSVVGPSSISTPKVKENDVQINEVATLQLSVALPEGTLSGFIVQGALPAFASDVPGVAILSADVSLGASLSTSAPVAISYDYFSLGTFPSGLGRRSTNPEAAFSNYVHLDFSTITNAPDNVNDAGDVATVTITFVVRDEPDAIVQGLFIPLASWHFLTVAQERISQHSSVG